MNREPPLDRSAVIGLALVLAIAPLAGCLGGDDDGDHLYDSYAQAAAAPGEVFEPVNNTDSPVRLKLLEPQDASKVEDGGQQVVVLLFDSEANEPITDAEFRIEAFMPAMGHGTSPETNPTHDAHGVYVGQTTFVMGGTWMVNLDPTLADGTALEFDVEVQVGDEDGMDHGDGMDHDGNMTGDGMDHDGNMTNGNQTEDPEPTFENHNATHEDEVTGIDYAQTYEFPVETVNATRAGFWLNLTSTAPSAQLELRVLDANGTAAVSGSVTPQAPELMLEVTGFPVTGTWTVEVSGQGVAASYVLGIVVQY